MGLLPGAGLGQCVMVLSFNFLAKGLGLGVQSTKKQGGFSVDVPSNS